MSGTGIQGVYNQLQQKVQKEIIHNEYEYNDILHAFTFIINSTLYMIVIPLYYIDYIDYNLPSVSVTIIHEVGSE